MERWYYLPEHYVGILVQLMIFWAIYLLKQYKIKEFCKSLKIINEVNTFATFFSTNTLRFFNDFLLSNRVVFMCLMHADKLSRSLEISVNNII